MKKAILILTLLWLAACTARVEPGGPLKTAPASAAGKEASQTPAPTMTLTHAPSPTAAPSATAAPTITPTPPVGPLPVVSSQNGWMRYRNEIGGFEISIPQGTASGEPEARIKGEVITGYAEGFKPTALSPKTYETITRQAYGDRLCTWIFYQRASIVIQSRKAPQELGQSCFDWGIRTDPLEAKTETVTIDGVDYPAGGGVLLDPNGKPYLALMMIVLPDGGVIGYSSETSDAVGYQDYLAAHTHEKILEIIKTYHALKVESTPAAPTDTPDGG